MAACHQSHDERPDQHDEWRPPIQSHDERPDQHDERGLPLQSHDEWPNDDEPHDGVGDDEPHDDPEPDDGTAAAAIRRDVGAPGATLPGDDESELPILQRQPPSSATIAANSDLNI